MPGGHNRQFAGVLAVNPDERRTGASFLPEDDAADGAGFGRAAHPATVARLAGCRLWRRFAAQMDDLASHGHSAVGLSIQLAIRSTACASMPT